MKIIAKFPSTCTTCGEAIAAGQYIDWIKGVRTVSHHDCNDRTINERPPVRQYERRPNQAEGRGSYAQFMGGAETFTNPRGRCEDAPCCGCCS